MSDSINFIREKNYFIKNNIPLDQLGWNHPTFDNHKRQIQEEEDFIENPYTNVEEGVIQCSKCGSKRTFSYQKQVRSSDEGFSLFVNCVNCNASWREN